MQMYVSNIRFVYVSTTSLLDCETVPILWYCFVFVVVGFFLFFCFFFHFISRSSKESTLTVNCNIMHK
jgi:hypothetical protein